MDDGVRTDRFAPFFANSGFYFLRANDKSRNFMHDMLVGFDQIMSTGSHQPTLAHLLMVRDEAHDIRSDLPLWPPDFFDAQGVRVWAKLSTRKGLVADQIMARKSIMITRTRNRCGEDPGLDFAPDLENTLLF